MKYFSYSHFFTWKHWGILYLVVVILMSLPLISVIFSSLVSHGLGCELRENTVPDCPGGSVLSVLSMTGWLGLITFPFGLFLLIVLALANVLWYLGRHSDSEL
jgi:hypothetical protein